MQVRRVASVAALAVLAAGAFAPAVAGPKKAPITKSYNLNLIPLWASPSGACVTPQFEGISLNTQTIKPTGPGILTVKVNGFMGDWDISIKDEAGEEISKGSGNDTPNPGPGEEIAESKFKKAQTIKIAICNFAGSPSAKATFTYKYL